MAHDWHWRRHPESVTSDRHYTAASRADKTVVASACGRLVDYQEAVGDLEDVGCQECLDVAEAEELVRVLADPGRAVGNCHVTYYCSCPRHRAQRLLDRMDTRG